LPRIQQIKGGIQMQQAQDQLSTMPAFMAAKLMGTAFRGAIPALLIATTAAAGGLIYGAVKAGQGISKYAQKTKAGDNKASKLFRDLDALDLKYPAKVACIDAHALEALCCLGKIERDDFACLCFYGLDISFKSELVQGWFERYIVDDIIIINPEDEDYKVIEIQLNKEA